MIPKIQRDDCLSTRDGHLYIEDYDTVDLARRFGTPLFVLSENKIRRNLRCFQESFEKGWTEGPVKIMPAVKANWIPAVQRIIVDEGCGCDVYSPGELSIALDAGFEPDHISVNGVPKDEEHIYRCVKEGVRITIDSMEEVALIERAADELGSTALVRLRLKPHISGFCKRSDFSPEGLVPTDIAAMIYKNGLSYEEIMGIAPQIVGMKNVELVGFHVHQGRHHPSTRYWQEQMKSFAYEVGRVCKALGGFKPQEIDIGGGFAVGRNPFNALTDHKKPVQLAVLHLLAKALRMTGRKGRDWTLSKVLERIVTRSTQKEAPTIEDYAEVCTRTLREELQKNGIDIKELTLQVEPGRAIHENAGIHLATVKNLKRITHPFRWSFIIVDTTLFWFTAGRLEAYLHDYVFANKTDAEMCGKADINGRSCGSDRLIPNVPVPEVEVGDLLAILDCGAYQEVSMSNYNAIPRPATLLVSGDEAWVIRRQETEEDVRRRDVIPAHLNRGSG